MSFRIQDAAAGDATSDLAQAAEELVDETVETIGSQIQQILDFHIPILDSIATDNPITVGSTLGFAIVLVATFWASRALQSILATALRRRGVTDEGTIGTTQRLTHYVLILFGFAIAIEVLGFDLTALFAAGAVVAVGIGFAMQNILQNFVSGFILLIERSIKPADVLEVEGRIVRVETMGVRATIVRTWDDEQIIIPNSTLAQGTVKNFTLSDELYRVRCKVGVAYETDLDHAQEVLLAAARGMEGRSTAKDPVVLIWEFGDSSIVFDVSIWIHNVWKSRVNRSQLNHAIWKGLKEAGITIAFPQLDVHFDPGVGRPSATERRHGGEAAGPGESLAPAE